MTRLATALGVPTLSSDFARAVPRVASLTQLQGGAFAVSVHATGSGPVVLALPHQGTLSELSSAELARATVMSGLVPRPP